MNKGREKKKGKEKRKANRKEGEETGKERRRLRREMGVRKTNKIAYESHVFLSNRLHSPFVVVSMLYLVLDFFAFVCSYSIVRLFLSFFFSGGRGVGVGGGSSYAFKQFSSLVRANSYTLYSKDNTAAVVYQETPTPSVTPAPSTPSTYYFSKCVLDTYDF